jgi:peptidoglycan biosynthesis protein MviN/MurJ (putative lipid II flippase)
MSRRGRFALGPGTGIAAGIAGAAALVALVSLVARLVGFGRQLVYQGAVGPTDLGTVYTSSNFVPAILFEIVAGGALAGVVVPLVVSAVERRDTAEVRETTGALIGWTLVVLVPIAVAGAILAGPISSYTLQGQGGAQAQDMAERMLRVFLIQVPLYGLAAVSAGVLQAHRRFLAPAIAPIVSSVVVASTYLVFDATFTGDRNDLGTVPRSAEVLLSVGTALGAVALALTTLVPLFLLGARGAPRLRFPAGRGRHAAKLAAAGATMVAAQQVALLVLIPVVNQYGGTGRIVTYQNSWMVYLLPYAVLAVPIATSSFPALAGHASRGNQLEWARTTLGSTRAVVLAAGLGVAALIAAAWPIARFFGVIGEHGTVPDAEMARALVAFAPGLLGFCLIYHLNRALLAVGRVRRVAAATTVGWAVAVLIAIVLASMVSQGWVVAAVGLGHTVGMAVAAGLLLAALRPGSAGAGWRRLARAGLAGLAGAAVGGVAGFAAAAVLDAGSLVATVVSGLIAAGVSAVIFMGVIALLDRDDLRAVLRR